MVSCTKNNNVILTDDNSSNQVSLRSDYEFEGVSFQNGYIKFSTLGAFDTFLTEFAANEELSDEFYSEFYSHYSHFQAFEDFISDTLLIDTTNWATSASDYSNLVSFIAVHQDTNLVEPAVTSAIIKHIANSDGIFVIEDTAYCFRYDSVYIFDYQYLDDWSTYKHSLLSIPNVHTDPILRSDIYECRQQYNFGEGFWKRHHVTGEWSKETFAPLYSELRVTTKHRRFVATNWWYRKTKNLEHVGAVSWVKCTTCDPLLVYGTYVSKSCTNCSNIQQVIVSGANTSFYFWSPSEVEHKAKCLDNEWRSCIISI